PVLRRLSRRPRRQRRGQLQRHLRLPDRLARRRRGRHLQRRLRRPRRHQLQRHLRLPHHLAQRGHHRLPLTRATPVTPRVSPLPLYLSSPYSTANPRASPSTSPLPPFRVPRLAALWGGPAVLRPLSLLFLSP